MSGWFFHHSFRVLFWVTHSSLLLGVDVQTLLGLETIIKLCPLASVWYSWRCVFWSNEILGSIVGFCSLGAVSQIILWFLILNDSWIPHRCSWQYEVYRTMILILPDHNLSNFLSTSGQYHLNTARFNSFPVPWSNRMNATGGQWYVTVVGGYLMVAWYRKPYTESTTDEVSP